MEKKQETSSLFPAIYVSLYAIQLSVYNIMKQRSFVQFLAVTLIALIFISISGCNSLSSQSPLPIGSSRNPSAPGAAIFVSRQAPVMLSMLMNPDRLSLGNTATDLEKLKTGFLANTGLNYKEDIQPWLGEEITLAVTTLDIDRDPENGKQLGYLIALATNEPAHSRQFVELFFSKKAIAGANILSELYKGVKVIYDNSHPEKGLLSGAAVGNKFVLFANDPKVLRDAINNVQAAELNLSSDSKYQQATKQIPSRAAVVAFLNLPKVGKWQGLNLENATYDNEILALVLNPQGLLAETTFLAAADQETLPPPASLSDATGVLQYIPDTAAVVISGLNLSSLNNTNLAQLWKQIVTAISASHNQGSVLSLQSFTDLEKRWGINLADDIFSWVQGEYSIGLLPGKKQENPDWIFIAEKTPDATVGISHLDSIAADKGFSISSLNLGEQKLAVWTELTTSTKKSSKAANDESITLTAKVRGLHTTLGKYEVFSNSIEAINQVLKAQENSLADNRNFQNSIAAIPQDNHGYVYIDWTKSQDILQQQLPILKLLKLVGKPFFTNLRSLTISSYDSEQNLLKAGMFVKFDSSKSLEKIQGNN